MPGRMSTSTMPASRPRMRLRRSVRHGGCGSGAEFAGGAIRAARRLRGPGAGGPRDRWARPPLPNRRRRAQADARLHYVQSPVQATAMLLGDRPLDPADIESVEIQQPRRRSTFPAAIGPALSRRDLNAAEHPVRRRCRARGRRHLRGELRRNPSNPGSQSSPSAAASSSTMRPS